MDVFVNKPGSGNPTSSTTGLPKGDYDAITQAPGVPGTPQDTTVICTTTSTKDGAVGAGLIVKFTTTNTDPPQNPSATGDYTTVTYGNGYADNDTLEIDGFPGSVLTINGLTA